MSIVLACAFPESAILLCDSRVSALGTSLRADTLRKAYQLSPLLVVGFASDDVIVTEKIIAVMTDYVLNHAKSKNTRYLLDKLPKVATYYYHKFTTPNCKPRTEFIFAGLDPSVSAVVSGKKLFELFRRALKDRGSSGSIPSRIILGMERQNGDAVPLPPPAAIVAKLVFPDMVYEDAAGLGYKAAGSDVAAAEKLQKVFEQVMIAGFDSEAIRQALIGSIIESHRKEQKIDTIGGLTQTLLVTEKGVAALGYSHTGITKDGKEVTKISMRFENDMWIQENSKNGKTIHVTKLPSQVKWNEKFEAGSIPDL